MDNVDEELPIAYCTKCGELLADRKKSTKIKYYEDKHSLTRNQKIKWILKSNLIFFFFAGMIVSTAAFIILNGMLSDGKEIIFPCSDEVKELNEVIKNEGFSSSMVNHLNDLREQCNIFIGERPI